MSATQARKSYGFQNAGAMSDHVEAAIQHAQCIRESIDKLSVIREHSVLEALGVPYESDESDCDESRDGEPIVTTESDPDLRNVDELVTTVKQVILQGNYNWFNILTTVSCLQSCSFQTIEHIAHATEDLEINGCNKKQLQTSFEALRADQMFNDQHRQRQVAILNGDIVTDSESDDPTAIQSASTPLDESLKALVQKRRKSILR